MVKQFHVIYIIFILIYSSLSSLHILHRVFHKKFGELGFIFHFAEIYLKFFKRFPLSHFSKGYITTFRMCSDGPASPRSIPVRSEKSGPLTFRGPDHLTSHFFVFSSAACPASQSVSSSIPSWLMGKAVSASTSLSSLVKGPCHSWTVSWPSCGWIKNRARPKLPYQLLPFSQKDRVGINGRSTWSTPFDPARYRRGFRRRS